MQQAYARDMLGSGGFLSFLAGGADSSWGFLNMVLSDTRWQSVHKTSSGCGQRLRLCRLLFRHKDRAGFSEAIAGTAEGAIPMGVAIEAAMGSSM